MADIAILGSMDSGHEDWAPRKSIEGDDSFTINGVPVHCDGMAWEVHTKPNATPHPGQGVASQSAFTVNGKAVCLVGDKVSCGSTIVTGDGSFTVG